MFNTSYNFLKIDLSTVNRLLYRRLTKILVFNTLFHTFFYLTLIYLFYRTLLRGPSSIIGSISHKTHPWRRRSDIQSEDSSFADAKSINYPEYSQLEVKESIPEFIKYRHRYGGDIASFETASTTPKLHTNRSDLVSNISVVKSTSSEKGVELDIDERNSWYYSSSYRDYTTTYTPKGGHLFKSVKLASTNIWEAKNDSEYSPRVVVDNGTKTIIIQLPDDKTDSISSLQPTETKQTKSIKWYHWKSLLTFGIYYCLYSDSE